MHIEEIRGVPLLLDVQQARIMLAPKSILPVRLAHVGLVVVRTSSWSGISQGAHDSVRQILASDLDLLRASIRADAIYNDQLASFGAESGVDRVDVAYSIQS